MKWLKLAYVISFSAWLGLKVIFFILCVFNLTNIGELVYGPDSEHLRQAAELGRYFWRCWDILSLLLFLTALVTGFMWLQRKAKSVAGAERKALTLKWLKMACAISLIIAVGLTIVSVLIFFSGKTSESMSVPKKGDLIFIIFWEDFPIFFWLSFLTAFVTGAMLLIKRVAKSN